jgi:hypothetical protein
MLGVGCANGFLPPTGDCRECFRAMTRLAFMLMLLLSGCGSLPQPFSKEQPLSLRDPLVAPPWETMVKAGPNASKEIDLETLTGRPPTAGPAPVDVAAAPPPQPEAAAPPADGRTAITSVAVVPVQGDGAKGNAELTEAMRDTLEAAGWTVRTNPAKDALTIKGVVQIGKAAGTTQAVKLSWLVAKPDGKALGTISQANAVPAGSLDAGWGPNARAATQAAAGGIFELIEKFR